MTDHHGENPIEPAAAGAGQPEGAPPPPADPPAPPPSAPAAPAATTGASSSTQYDLGEAKQAFQRANPLDLGIVAAGVVAFIGSLLPFYTASASVKGSIAGQVISESRGGSASAWHGFFGWFAALVALAVAVYIVATVILRVLKIDLSPYQVAVGGFGLSLLCTIIALIHFPGGASCDGLDQSIGGVKISCDTGRGFGFWLMALAVIAGLVLAVMRMREPQERAV